MAKLTSGGKDTKDYTDEQLLEMLKIQGERVEVRLDTVKPEHFRRHLGQMAYFLAGMLLIGLAGALFLMFAKRVLRSIF